MTLRILSTAALLALAACNNAPTAPAATATAEDAKAIGEQVHKAYIDAINSNDIDKFAAMVTDDIVFQAPGTPEIIGKDAVVAWGKGYFDAYAMKWEKTSIGFTQSGDWAFERYTYKVEDTDRATKAVTTDAGKGVNIFRRGSDGKWRVAVDSWSSDKPAS